LVDIPGLPDCCLRRVELVILCADGRFADRELEPAAMA
jgi:hypothetical protein